jgi:hypothetical protein
MARIAFDISAFGITSGNFAVRLTFTDVGADTLVAIDGDAGTSICSPTARQR